MKTAFVMVGFLVLIGSVVLAQQPAKPPKNAKPTFALTVSTDQDTVAPGAKMIVTIHFTNVSDHALSFGRFGFGGPHLAYRVEDRGNWLLMRKIMARGCDASPAIINLSSAGAQATA